MIDNPPFSILSKIQEFYLEKDVPFFLFAPSLTCLSSSKCCMRTTHIICDCDIEYANGAVVRTSFVTNMGGDVIAKTAPGLTRKVNDIVKELHKENVSETPKYEYPDHVVTAAIMQRWAKYGVDFEVRASDCARISKLDMQASKGKGIFGSGLILSNEAAIRRHEAERCALERAANERAKLELALIEAKKDHVWELSERERKIVDMLGSKPA